MHSEERTVWGQRTRRATARRGFRGHLARGIHLTGTSLRVLAKDPQLLVLPFLALILTGFLWLLVFVSVLALGFPPWSPSSGFLYQEMFVAYLLTYFLSVYFMTAIIAAMERRLAGEGASVAEGIQVANACLPRLAAWSLVAATLGGILRLLALRSEGAARAVSRLLGYTWPIATVFVLPAIVFEDVGPLKAFRRSRELLRRVWGVHQTGVLGTGVVFAVLFVLGLGPFLWGIVDPGAVGWAVAAVFYWLVLGALWSVVHGILVTALYHYATASEASFGFAWQALNHPWVR